MRHGMGPRCERAAQLARRAANLKPGTMLAREWNGQMQRVAVLADGFAWNGKTYSSLSRVAFAITGTRWRFSGGNTDRPALQRLLGDLRAGKVDVSCLQGRPPDPVSCCSGVRSR